MKRLIQSIIFTIFIIPMIILIIGAITEIKWMIIFGIIGIFVAIITAMFIMIHYSNDNHIHPKTTVVQITNPISNT